MYRVCTACQIPPVFPYPAAVCSRTLCASTDRRYTHLCRHLRYRGCLESGAAELPAVRSFKLRNSTSSSHSPPPTLDVANSRYSPSLFLSSTLFHHIFSASPSPTVSPPALVRQRFLFLPAHILHSDLVLFFPFTLRLHCLF